MAKKEVMTAEVQTAAENETKVKAKAAKEKKEGGGVLEKVGKAAIKEHGLEEVFVTSDGAVFRAENDAKNYAANLKNRGIINVKK